MNKFEHSDIDNNASQDLINKEIEKFLNNIIFNNYGNSTSYDSKSMSYVLRIIKDSKLFKSYYNKNILFLDFALSSNEYGSKIINKIRFKDFFFKKKRENSQIRDYMYAEYELADFMKMLGYKFNKTETKHIKMLAFALFINENGEENIEFDVDKFNRLKDIIELCSDEIKTKEYIKKYITTMHREDDYVIEAINKLIYLKKEEKICIPDKIAKNMKLIDICFNFMAKVDLVENEEEQKKGLNMDFVNKIKEKIKPDISKQQLPYELYKVLSKLLAYDTAMFVIPQDAEIPVVDKVYNRPMKSITEENNRVACKTWSQIYAHLLNLYGITAYPFGKFHKSVIFLDENDDMCIADATNAVKEAFQMLRFTDMNRAKLNLNPLNFYKISVNNKFELEKLHYRHGQFLPGGEIEKSESDFLEKERDMFFGIIQDSKNKNTIDKEILQKVFQKIEERRNIPEELVRVESYDKDVVNKQKLYFISYLVTNLMKEYEKDDLLRSNIINNLFYILFKNKNNIANLSRSLYRINENKDVEIVPICYLKQKLKKVYYIWDNNEGFVEISKEILQKRIDEGEFIIDDIENKKYLIGGIRNSNKTLNEKIQALENR